MNKITILDNKYCKVELDDATTFNALRFSLSFKQQGVEYTQAYKNGWNGITYLLNKNGVFLSGLLTKTLSFLKDRELQFELVDKRIKELPGNELLILDRLKAMDKEPRDYQLRTVQVAAENEKGILRLATGAGKSLITALITAKFNKPTIVYVIGLNLLDQFHKLFSEIFDEPIGRIGNGIVDIKRITIASIWTIGRALDMNTKRLFQEADECNEDEIFNGDSKVDILRALKEYKIHLLDECHVATTDTILAIYKQINPERIYGLSGTPYRDDGSDLFVNGILGEQIVNVSASELIEKGVLAKPYIRFFTVPKMFTEGRTYPAIYKEYIVENNVRNAMIVEHTQKLLEKGYAPLVLFRTIPHGKILAKLFTADDIRFEMLYGIDDLDRRLDAINKFNRGEIDVLLSSVIFDIGLDLPKLSALINTGGSKSSIRTLQRVGRTLRSYPGKTQVLIIDYYDQVRYLKEHSKKRFKIYSSEKGFEVIPSTEMINVNAKRK